MSSVLYFPASTDVNGTVWQQPNCVDVPLTIYSLTFISQSPYIAGHIPCTEQLFFDFAGARYQSVMQSADRQMQFTLLFFFVCYMSL